MPLSHRHMHNHRDVFKDVGDFFDGLDPFAPKDSSDEKSPRDDGDGGNGRHATVVKTVYRTMAQTFTGKAAGYKTIRSTTEVPKPTRAAKKPAATTEEPKFQQAKGTPVPPKERTSTSSKVSKKKTTSIPTAISVPDKTTSHQSVLAKATGHATVSHASDLGGNREITKTPTQASIVPTAQSSSTTNAKEDASTSPGAKAGIAFGVLGGVFIVGLLVFFLFNRRRKQSKERMQIEDDDEKFRAATGGNPNPFESSTTTRSDPRAPRISLRPVTQFLPNWNVDRRASKGAAMSLTPAAAISAWDRPSTSQSSHSANPFGNQAERAPSPITEDTNSHNPSSPYGRADDVVPELTPRQDPLTANGPALAMGAAAGAGAMGGLTRKASMRKGGPSNLDLTLPVPHGQVPASPAGTEFSMSSVIPDGGPAPSSAGAAAIAASGGPANSAVHRVQLDFKPTLEDEMGLNAGDLVRLLHEYDDGWALCIRLDRSQQGVVPRTCLSTRPVKPRPQGGPRPGPPVNPSGYPRGPNPNYGQGGRPMPQQGQRPMTPQGQRPMTPQGMSANRMGPGPRPASPAGRPMGPPGRSQSPMGRPMSPGGRPMSTGPRAQSPGPRQRGPPGGRSQSPSGMNRRMTPPGSSPMNPAQSPAPGPPTGPVGRKPVPGQAY